MRAIQWQCMNYLFGNIFYHIHYMQDDCICYHTTLNSVLDHSLFFLLLLHVFGGSSCLISTCFCRLQNLCLECFWWQLSTLFDWTYWICKYLISWLLVSQFSFKHDMRAVSPLYLSLIYCYPFCLVHYILITSWAIVVLICSIFNLCCHHSFCL